MKKKTYLIDIDLVISLKWVYYDPCIYDICITLAMPVITPCPVIVVVRTASKKLLRFHVKC